MTYRLKALLALGNEYISACSEGDLTFKSSPDKWSKKEILGHLIDSAINNLQRLTEIQFEDKPYNIRKYKQVELVLANYYQDATTSHLLNFWLSLNLQMSYLIDQQTEASLAYQVLYNDNNKVDLAALIKDYIDHLEHHLNQIIPS